MTTEQVADLLGITSEETIKNWLHGGHFPGAYINDYGYWCFDPVKVMEVMKQMALTKHRNNTGDLSPDDE